MDNTPNTGNIASKAVGDHAFALAAQRGDERAFGILFERYQHKIFAVALRHTRVPEDAEDIVQQTFPKHGYSTGEGRYERHCSALGLLHKAFKEWLWRAWQIRDVLILARNYGEPQL